jgi:hypothetical protein
MFLFLSILERKLNFLIIRLALGRLSDNVALKKSYCCATKTLSFICTFHRCELTANYKDFTKNKREEKRKWAFISPTKMLDAIKTDISRRQLIPFFSNIKESPPPPKKKSSLDFLSEDRNYSRPEKENKINKKTKTNNMDVKMKYNSNWEN